MTKRDIVIFLFKWKYSLIGYFVFVVAAVTVFTYVSPKQYEAKAAVLVESNRAPAMRSDIAYGVEQLSVLNSETAIIRSQTVLSDTVDKIGSVPPANAPASGLARWVRDLVKWTEEVGLKEPMTPRQSFIRTLEKDLAVAPRPNSNVITITFRGKDPERAARIVNTVTDSYIDHHLKIYSSAGTSEVYRLQLGRIQKELDSERRELTDFKRRTEVSAIDDTMHALVRRESELTSELAAIRSKLSELRTRFGPGHTTLSLAEEEEQNIKKALAETRRQLQRLEKYEEKIHDMEVRIASTERSYQEYQKRYEEERLTDLANPDVVNVRVIEYATVPTRPDHSRIYYIALSVVGGLLLSCAIAFIKEYFDHGVADEDVVAELMGVPTLGSVERF